MSVVINNPHDQYALYILAKLDDSDEKCSIEYLDHCSDIIETLRTQKTNQSTLNPKLPHANMCPQCHVDKSHPRYTHTLFAYR